MVKPYGNFNVFRILEVSKYQMLEEEIFTWKLAEMHLLINRRNDTY